MDLAARVALALRRGTEAHGRHTDVDDALARLRAVLETSAPEEPEAVAAAQEVLAALEHHEVVGPDEPDSSDDVGSAGAPPQRPFRVPVSGGFTRPGPDPRRSASTNEGEPLD